MQSAVWPARMRYLMIDRLRRSAAWVAMLRYSVVGMTGTFVDWLLFALLVYVLDWHYMLAGTLSFILATLVNYLLSLKWVFTGGRHARHREITLVYLASAVGLLINLGVLYGLVEFLALHLFLAKVLASLSAFLWNFSARYFWIFAGPRPVDAREPSVRSAVE